MIERMKKITIVCLDDDQERSLQSLRNLASVHVSSHAPQVSVETATISASLSDVSQLLYFLESLDVKGALSTSAPEIDGEEATSRALRILGGYRKRQGELSDLRQTISVLAPWGHFDASVLGRLKDAGWDYALVARINQRGWEKWFDSLDGMPDGAREFVVTVTREKVYSLVVSPSPLLEGVLPAVTLPTGTDLATAEAKFAEAQKEGDRLLAELKRIAAEEMAAIRRRRAAIAADLDYAETRDRMLHAGDRLCYLQGYVPETRLDELRLTARENGWAIRYDDVVEDDSVVPTSLVMPKHLDMAKSVLDFIGILPGYNEIDISVAVLLFLSLFSGMLVGDAGYGVIFTLLCLWGLWKARKRGDDGLLHNLQALLLMSACVFAWGALSGNWFGLNWGGLEFLTDKERGPLNVQLFCFFLAAVHLSMAHLWKMKDSLSLRDKLGNLGWAIFLWANFFTVKCLLIDFSFEHFGPAKYLYAVGTALVLLFAINWRNVGDAIYSPFTFINSISDILSYIRLYAVGLSSVYIAQAFNDMSANIWSQKPWLIPVGLLIVLAGHALNIAMALMSVLVHGIRLNTLEFSGRVGVEWGGRAYRPFANPLSSSISDMKK